MGTAFRIVGVSRAVIDWRPKTGKGTAAGRGTEMAEAFTLDQFVGRWRSARRIRHDDGTHARSEGTVELSPDGEGLRWVETGRLRMSMHNFHYERRYLWRQSDDGIEVLFEDGRPFHRFAPRVTATGHRCPPDRYRVIYSFDLPQAWSTRWRVDGPRKGYAIEALFRR